ncbi:Fanconi anemia core complex-associated protein 100 [Megalops cyprinoides]|uniref:Fanconi anemia core complex-associated protein 100 n=1 Tax=Megalops cyprinoides TaxID=118141 RepID=UPI001863FF39|nr:Fanconi anemia core complex-associated protein 100 [Megalops cyprinoides]
MAGLRCSVESIAELQGSSRPVRVIWHRTETEILLSNGGNQVFTCNVSSPERGVTAVHRFPGRVVHVQPSADGRSLHALCENEGVFLARAPQRPRTLSSTPSADSGCGPNAVTVSPDSCVIRDSRIRAFTLVKREKVLVTVAREGAVWRFGVYEVPDAASPCYRSLAELCLPAVGGAGRGGADAPPVLSCVRALRQEPAEGGDFLLEPVVFSVLFGVDAALLSSPMILCGLPDGRICSLPLLLPGGGRVRVLHSLEQPIAFIGTCAGAAGGPHSLLVIGRSGRMLVVRAEEGAEGKGAGFRELQVSGPVECACVSDTHLYYSTCVDLLALPLADTPTPALHTPLSLGITQLVGVSLRGRLLQISLPQGSGGGHAPRLSAAQVGQRVRDLLAGIANMADRASSLKSSIQLRNKALRGLNQVFNICCLLLPDHDGRNELPVCKRPISCHTETRWISLLQQDSLVLSCIVENSSSYTLEPGWTLCVEVIPLSHAKTLVADAPAQTYSFPLQKLAPGNKVEVTLPLGSESELSLPVTVRCSLVYSLQSMLAVAVAGRALARGGPLAQLGEDSGCVSLPLRTLTVDTLDCLRPDRPAGHTHACGSATGLLRTFLRSRGAERQGGVGEEGAAVPAGGPFSACVRVSCALLRAALGPPAPGGPPLSSLLLRWLLSRCPGLDQGGVAVCVRGPGGDALKLTAREMTVSDASAGGAVPAVELQVDSASLRAVCGLHHALLCHLQALFEDLLHPRGPASLGVSVPQRSVEKLIRVYQQLRNNPLLLL